MKEYTGDKIRNVAIVGHGGAGTTSVTEALLYRSVQIMSKVEMTNMANKAKMTYPST